MRKAYIVTPGNLDPVEVVGYDALPNGNFRLVLRSGLHEYGRVVTRKGLAAIHREAVAVMLPARREVAA